MRRLDVIDKPPPPQKMAGGAAITAAAAAVVCGVCCVLPFALPPVILASTGAALASFGRAQRPLTAVAFVMTAAAWTWVWRQSARTRARPAPSTLILMGVASAFFAVALIWPFIEPLIVRTLVRH